ncbi:hypothetical protein DVJ78_17345 [Humibacter sp. BT305]|nr:hypothetical protein DVJ78_17345 [Humibacter sp. BT305]
MAVPDARRDAVDSRVRGCALKFAGSRSSLHDRPRRRSNRVQRALGAAVLNPKIAVVGDIHGEIRRLERAVEWLTKWDGSILFMGDYVNRGAHSREVLDALISLKSELGDRATFLLGNHDLALRDFIDGGSEHTFLAHGGLTTLHSYIGTRAKDDPLAQMREDFPVSHRRFLSELAVYLESPEFIAAHCGIDPEHPSARTIDALVTGSHPRLFEPGIELPKMVVSGHYAQRSGRPFIGEQFVCVDSGCGVVPEAPLAIVLLPSRDVVLL